MQIRAVSLTDFKIHRDRHVTFQPGVNAICGENGAGKTSILEAIAWVLFDYDSGYRKEDLRRQGASATRVMVELVSALDGRVYQVQRQSGRSRADQYDIYDPQLNLKLENVAKVQDASQWLRQHLGFAAGADLPKLFSDVIGIPQGTFTVDFSRSAAERRRVFDPLLSVESYREAFKAAADLERYAQAQVQELEQQLDRADTQLQRAPELRRQRQDLQQRLEADRDEQTRLGEQRRMLEVVIAADREQQDQIRHLQADARQLRARQEALAQQQPALETQLIQAQQARETLERTRPAVERYEAVREQLQALAEQQRQRDRLRQEQRTCEQARQQEQQEQARLEQQLQTLERQRQEAEALRPAAERQTRLEDQQQKLRQQRDGLINCYERERLLREQAGQLSTELASLDVQLEALAPLMAEQAALPQLEAEQQRQQQQLARSEVLGDLAQRWSRDLQSEQQQAEALIRALPPAEAALEPLRRSAATAAIAPLETALGVATTLLQQSEERRRQWLERLRANDATQLRRDLATVGDRLARLRQQQRTLAQQPLLERQRRDRAAQLAQVQQELAQLQPQLGDLQPIERRLQDLETALAALDNPRTRLTLLEQDLAQAPALEQRWQTLQAQMSGQARQLQSLEEALTAFAELDQAVDAAEAQRRQLEPEQQQYLQAEPLARRQPELEQQLRNLSAELEALGERAARTEAEARQRLESLDTARLEQQQRDLEAVQHRLGELAGSLPLLDQEATRLEAELAQLTQLADRQQQDRQRLEQRRRLQQFIVDARRVYNQSGPRITRYYLSEVTREADRLFRELMNRPGVALDWSEDYEIRVQEEGRWRGFRTLSGGEQMCAALAVRLSLLRILANGDVAFFDEPTTNMDVPRRRQLAEALAGLNSFRQLFVISHDDTFESLTDSIIRVEREVPEGG